MCVIVYVHVQHITHKHPEQQQQLTTIRHVLPPYTSDHKNCNCGYRNENATHYLLKCPLYNESRNLTIFNLPPLARKCQILLNGHANFSLAFNEYIVLIVQEFITLSGRYNLT